MAKCHRNNVDPLILLGVPTASSSSSSSSSSGNTFAGSSFRRKIYDAISCGGSSRYGREIREDEGEIYFTETTVGAPESFVRESEKLCDLLNLAELETDVETKKKVEALEVLKRVVKELQMEETCGNDGGYCEKKLTAASEVRSLAKDDKEARVTLAMLGAIPPLVSMIDDSRIADAQIASLYALLNIGIGNDANKAAIVKAGAVDKMLKLIESSKASNQAISEAVIANFLGLSALDSNKPFIGSSGAINFLVKTLKNLEETNSSQAREDALRALYNLSIFQANIHYILNSDLIPFLLNSLGDMEVSEKILAILSNVVSVSSGRKAIRANADAIPVLVDVLNWNDSPKCQEKAIYILMVMAHKDYGDRQAMIEAGIESTLLELTLIGTTLSQKRASKLLDCLRGLGNKGRQVSESPGSCGALSAPISETLSTSLTREGDEIRMSDERKAVKELVQQSLQSNMKRIVKRANLQQDFVTSERCFKSTTKSLTF